MPYKDRAKQREYQRNRTRRLRQEMIVHLGSSCVWCGSVESLEIDHVDRSTKKSHRITTWSPAKKKAELSRCQLLCKPCHIEKSRLNQDYRHK